MILQLRNSSFFLRAGLVNNNLGVRNRRHMSERIKTPGSVGTAEKRYCTDGGGWREKAVDELYQLAWQFHLQSTSLLLSPLLETRANPSSPKNILLAPMSKFYGFH